MFDEQKQNLLNWATRKLEKERTRGQLVRVILLSVGGEILALLAAVMAPQPLADATAFAASVEGKIVLYLLAIPFACGFMLAFAAIKFMSPKNSRRRIEHGSFMSRYEDYSNQEDQRLVFLICAGIGGLNALIFFFVASWSR